MKDIKKLLKKLLQEAELYKNQGLLNESKEKYKEAALLVKQLTDVANKKAIIDLIINKVKGIEKQFQKIQKKSANPDVPDDTQNLIKKLFSYSKDNDEDKAELEGALALAKFGLFEKAISELTKLLSRNSIKDTAAHNILRCYIANDSVEQAVSQYQKWMSDDIFPLEKMQKMLIILEEGLKRKGLSKDFFKQDKIDKTDDFEKIYVIEPVKKDPEKNKPPETHVEFEEFDAINSVDKKQKPVDLYDYEIEDFLDIVTAVEITLDIDKQKNKKFRFDVNIQTGNTINIIVSKNEIDFLKHIEIGKKLNNIYCYSLVNNFNGKGFFKAKNRISSGQKNGDYSLDISIEIK